MVSQASIARTSTSATFQTLQTFRRNPLALWRGYGALAGRNLPFTALQFPLYERVRSGIWEWRRQRRREKEGERESKRDEDVGVLEHGAVTAIAAGSAGALAAVVTTPVDVVKTRIMLAAATSFADQGSGSGQGFSNNQGKEALEAVKKGNIADALGGVTEGEKPAYRKMSSLGIARDIVAEQGWKGLWRGGALRGIWTLLGSGLYLGVYEGGKVWLGRRGGREDEEG